MAPEAKFTPKEVIAINQGKSLPKQAEKMRLYNTIVAQVDQAGKEKPLCVFSGFVYPYVMLGGNDALFTQFCQGYRDKSWQEQVLLTELPKLQALKTSHPELFNL